MIKSLSVKQNVTFAGTNALPRYTSSVGSADTFPSEGKAERTVFAPNTETFSALHPTSVTYLSQLARSPGVLRGRSRIEFIFSSRLSDESMNLTSRRNPLSVLSCADSA